MVRHRPPRLRSRAGSSSEARIKNLEALIPSQSHMMADVGDHFTNLWFAGGGRELAACGLLLSETKSHLRWAVRRIPIRKDNRGRDINLTSILDAFENSQLTQLKRTIDGKDKDAFLKKFYRESLTMCYSCHTAADKPYLRPQIPTEGGVTDHELRSQGPGAALIPSELPAAFRQAQINPRGLETMNPIVFALRHPITVMVGIAAVVLGSGLALYAHEGRHLPQPQPAGRLRRPALRRHGPRPDGRADHQLLRVPLPLHQRHPPRRVAERPGRGPDEAVLPPRHRHGPGDGRDGRLRQPLPGLHAARHGAAVHHALRHRQRAGRLPGARSETRSIGEIQDQALFKVRPMFASLPGVSAPPPFGGNQRTVVVRVDPDRLRAYNVSPEEVSRR